MTLTSPTTPNATENLVSGPVLWSAQAQMPSVLGRQLVINRGEGPYVFTEAGQRLFDGTAGLWHANVGHSHPELATAAFAQMQRLETFHIFQRYANDRAIELGERLATISPIDNPKVVLNSGGSDAIDVAAKLARRHWQRAGKTSKQIMLSREHSYHGLHAYGTSIAGLDFNREGYGTDSLVPETGIVSFDDIAEVERQILKIGPDNIAAIFTEAIQGTGGVNPPEPGYLEGLQRLCREHDILLVVDEVITGFGRTGEWFASQRYGLEPDMVTFAKGVTSGYAPLGGVFVAPNIWEPFFVDSPDTPIFRHGATYAGHATAAAVAIANLDVIERDGLVPRVRELEELLRAELTALRDRVDAVTDVRVAGFLGGVTLNERVAADKVADTAVELGFITRPLRGNNLQLSPPFVVSDQQVIDYVAAIEQAINDQELS